MPSSSKAQHNLMAAVAHNAAFAKKVGIPQSVGKDFNEADKGRKFSRGGDMATKKMAAGGSTVGKTGTSEKKGMTTEKMAKVKTAAPSRDGIAERGKTRGMMPKMAGSDTGMKRGGKTRK